ATSSGRWWRWTRPTASASGDTISGRNTSRSAGCWPNSPPRGCWRARRRRRRWCATRSWRAWACRPTRPRSSVASRAPTCRCGPSRSAAAANASAPGSIEAYYQEVGRAGRDGADALGLLLVSARDLPLRRVLLERGAEGAAPDPTVVEHKWSQFLELIRWVEGGSCRHDAILRYFGDEAETLNGCGRCDVCRRLATAEAPHSPAETALIVRKALSGVARVHGRFGLLAAVKLVHGDA